MTRKDFSKQEKSFPSLIQVYEIVARKDFFLDSPEEVSKTE